MLCYSWGVSLIFVGEWLVECVCVMLCDLDVVGCEVCDIDQGCVGLVYLGLVLGFLLDLVLFIVCSLECVQLCLWVKIDVGSSDRLLVELLLGQFDLYLGCVFDCLDLILFELLFIGFELLLLIVCKDYFLVQGCDLVDCLWFDWVMQFVGSMLFMVVKIYFEWYDLFMLQMVIEMVLLMLIVGFVLNLQVVGVMLILVVWLFVGDFVWILFVVEDLWVGFYLVVMLCDCKLILVVQIFLKFFCDELWQWWVEF